MNKNETENIGTVNACYTFSTKYLTGVKPNQVLNYTNTSYGDFTIGGVKRVIYLKG